MNRDQSHVPTDETTDALAVIITWDIDRDGFVHDELDSMSIAVHLVQPAEVWLEFRRNDGLGPIVRIRVTQELSKMLEAAMFAAGVFGTSGGHPATDQHEG